MLLHFVNAKLTSILDSKTVSLSNQLQCHRTEGLCLLPTRFSDFPEGSDLSLNVMCVGAIIAVDSLLRRNWAQ
jgi:hypothetical protein